MVEVDKVARTPRMNEETDGLAEAKYLIDAEDDVKDTESHASDHNSESANNEHRGQRDGLENDKKEKTESVVDKGNLARNDDGENIPTCEIEGTELLVDGGNFAVEAENDKKDKHLEFQNASEGQLEDNNVEVLEKFDDKFEGKEKTEKTENETSEGKLQTNASSGEKVGEESISEINYISKEDTEDKEYAKQKRLNNVSHEKKILPPASTKMELLHKGSRKHKKTIVYPPPPKSITTVSSIDINISRIIHGDSETDVGNTVAMVTTKSVDFSMHTGIDEVEQELARVVGCDDGVSTFSDFPGGRAAATNTPVER